MLVKDCMKKNVAAVSHNETVAGAAAIFVQRHVGLLPVVDDQGKPIGVVRLSDLLSLELPDFIYLVEDMDFVHDFGAVETTRPPAELLAKPVTSLMQPLFTVEESDGLLRTYALMLQNEMLDIPVVNARGELTGIVSRVDIGVAVLSLWALERKA